MSVLAPPLPVPTPAPTPPLMSAPPRPFLWTCPQFYAICDAGFMEGRNVILINGEILEMPPPEPGHSTGITLADYKLQRLFADGFVVRVQLGLPLGLAIEPVPDLAVVRGSIRDFTAAHPSPQLAVLVVEVSDTSLSYDRGEKANLYAAAGIPDYWVIDVANGRVEVFRDPRPDPALPSGAGYSRVTTHGPADSIAPLEKPAAAVRVAELLP